MSKSARVEARNRSGRRPSRATYWLWFVLAAILAVGMFAYLVSALARGLLDWPDLWAIEANFVIGGCISLAVGLVFRARWRRRRAAVRAYEQVLSSVATADIR